MTVTANPRTKVYGTDDPTLTDTATGFVNTTVDGIAIDDTGDGADRVARSGAVGHAGRREVGHYAIAQGTLAADSYYTISFTGGTMTITPSPLTVTANPVTKVYGTDDPTLTDTATGFVDTTVDGLAIDDTAASALTGPRPGRIGYPGRRANRRPTPSPKDPRGQQLHDELHRRHADCHPRAFDGHRQSRDQGLRHERSQLDRHADGPRRHHGGRVVDRRHGASALTGHPAGGR